MICFTETSWYCVDLYGHNMTLFRPNTQIKFGVITLYLPPSNHIYEGGGNQNKVLQDRVTWTSADSYWIILMGQIQNHLIFVKAKMAYFF